MNEYYLILYCGGDYIIPIIDSSAGDAFYYKKDSGDNRLWLYFHDDPDTTDILYGQDNYRPARMGKNSYFGDYWENAANNICISIKGIDTPYVELPHRSSMIKDIQDWYLSIVHNSKGAIPVVCIYEDSITISSRKSFMAMLSNYGFNIRSFSISFNTLIAKYCGLSPEYGKLLVLANSSGDIISLSSMIYWNDNFTECGIQDQIAYEGESPIKRALIEHIIDSNNRNHGFLSNDKIKEEYVYQMQFADEWLNKARETSADGSFLVKYHLSIAPDIYYTCNIKKSFIISKQATTATPIISFINNFCHKIGNQNIVQNIYIGDIFADEEMYKMVSRGIENKCIYIDSSHIKDVLHIYSKYYDGLTESIKDFDIIQKERQKERDSATSWYSLAERILNISERVQTIEPQFNYKIEDFANRVVIAHNEAWRALKKHSYDEAKTAIESLQDCNGILKTYIHQSVQVLLTEHINNKSIYDKVNKFTYAQDIITVIDEHIKGIILLVDKYKELTLNIAEDLRRIDYFKTNYPRYKELRDKFDHSNSLIEKKQLLAQMRPLTAEELPQDPSEVKAVSGNIFSKICYKSRFGGLIKTPNSVEITVSLGQCKLPYRSTLIISDEPITYIDRDNKICIDIEKGATGNISYNLDLPIKNFPKTKVLYMRILIDKDSEQMVDISKVSFNICNISIK